MSAWAEPLAAALAIKTTMETPWGSCRCRTWACAGTRPEYAHMLVWMQSSQNASGITLRSKVTVQARKEHGRVILELQVHPGVHNVMGRTVS